MRSPSRKLKKSSVKNIVRFPAIKSNGGKSILVESILESKFCLLLEFNSEVTEYFPQPRTFKVPSANSEEHSTYTPDFEVHFQNGQRTFFEVKPKKYAESEEFTDLFERFEKMLGKTNYDFVVVTEDEILKEPRKTNFETLYRYKKNQFDKSFLYSLSTKYSVSPSISYLLSKHKETLSVRDIYTGLAKGYLRFDYENEKLSLKTEVTFNV